MLLLRYSTAVICAVFIATGAVSGEKKIKAVGDTVSFRLTNINPPVTSIIWKHRSSSGVVVKAIEWDDDGLNIPSSRFKNITTLDEKTGQITITKLTVEHSGVYTIDINSKEQEQRFILEVSDPKPVIQIRRSNKNPNAVDLICKYIHGTIIWKNSAGKILKDSNHDPKGEFITVENKRNPNNYYTCTVKNAVEVVLLKPGMVYSTNLECPSDGARHMAEHPEFIDVLLILAEAEEPPRGTNKENEQTQLVA
ncbi:SLAM family member 7-like isoform X1 [Labeo rohita]|uniref:SLAM family member 7-like isoform X1 n=1 Tax=Labeo rohita TaxID=84645 RepID=A0A498NJS8_LABRO|nr:SLAM family member 7-like isoform X1 [Labeo rohita]